MTNTGRGQTGFDFLVGMSVFLVTVGMVLTFTPGMFGPYDALAASNMVVAERGAASLTESLLVEDVDQPGVLNESCTESFFAGGGVADCRYDADAGDLHGALHVEEAHEINVTLQRDGSVATLDGVRLAAGPSPPGTGDIVVGKRMAIIGETRYTAYVRVW